MPLPTHRLKERSPVDDDTDSRTKFTEGSLEKCANFNVDLKAIQISRKLQQESVMHWKYDSQLRPELINQDAQAFQD